MSEQEELPVANFSTAFEVNFKSPSPLSVLDII